MTTTTHARTQRTQNTHTYLKLSTARAPLSSSPHIPKHPHTHARAHVHTITLDISYTHTSKCPPSAAASHVVQHHWAPLARSHFNTSRWPCFAALAHASRHSSQILAGSSLLASASSKMDKLPAESNSGLIIIILIEITMLLATHLRLPVGHIPAEARLDMKIQDIEEIF